MLAVSEGRERRGSSKYCAIYGQKRSASGYMEILENQYSMKKLKAQVDKALISLSVFLFHFFHNAALL